MVRVLLLTSGTLVVLFGVREVFRDIFHPTLSGSLSDWVGRLTSALLSHTRFRPAVGPFALVSVILCWAITLVFGFALIYCGTPEIDAGVPGGPAAHELWHRLLPSLYLSLGAFDTFQTFDVVLRAPWFRLLVAIEGLVGISMITASVSWLVLLYPALARIRSFAKETTILVHAEQATGLSVVRDIGHQAIDNLARQVVQFRLDIILFPILLNFYAADQEATISSVLPSISAVRSGGARNRTNFRCAPRRYAAADSIGRTRAYTGGTCS